MLTFLLAAAFVWSLTGIDWNGPWVHTGGGGAALNFLLALFPPDLSPDFLAIAVKAAWHTLAYSVAGLTVALLIGFPLGVIAVRGRVLRFLGAARADDDGEPSPAGRDASGTRAGMGRGFWSAPSGCPQWPPSLPWACPTGEF